MNTAVPVAGDVVVESCHGARLGNKMSVVQTWVAQVSPNLKVSYFGEGLNSHWSCRALVVTRQGEVHASTPISSGDKADGVPHHGKRARKIEPLGVK